MLLLHLLLSLFNISVILRISIYVSRKKGFNLWAAACRRLIQNTKISLTKICLKCDLLCNIWSRYNIVSIFSKFPSWDDTFEMLNIHTISNVKCFQNKVHYRILNVLRTKCHILYTTPSFLPHLTFQDFAKTKTNFLIEIVQKWSLGSYPSILPLLLSAILALLKVNTSKHILHFAPNSP